MKEQPLVSIIMPSYNSATYISHSIDSILSQTYTNWELLITDDCSKDNTYEILQEYKEKDNRIKIYRLSSNSGAGIARNNSIEKAQGNFIAFCDSDDSWVLEKLEKQVDFMIKNDIAFSYSDYFLVNELNEIVGKREFPIKVNYKDMLLNNYIGCLTAIYSVEKLDKIYMRDIRYGQDWLLWLDILKVADYAYNIGEVFAYYKIRTNSISANKVKTMKYNWIMYRKYENLSLINSLYYIIRYPFIYLKKIKWYKLYFKHRFISY